MTNLKKRRNAALRPCIFPMLLLWAILLHTPSALLFAQSLTQLYPPFTIEGRELSLATVGGLSSPQYSEVDLNNDGIQDLYLFDKMGQLGLTFLNDGTPNQVDYSYAPVYLANFPTLNEWVLLRDYNGDGIQDIFAYSSIPGVPGIEVYTGYYDDQNKIAFRRFQFTQGAHNIIYYPGSVSQNNLYVSNVDYPAVDDIDGDGDLDIITFNLGGGVVELYANQSVELGYGLDSLQYILVDDCWGRFYESGLSLEIDLSTSGNDCAGRFRSSEPRSGARHAGSTVLTLDMDNDGDKEVMLGDVSFSNLTLLTNGGSKEAAFMTAQEITFPVNSTPVEIPLFPAAYHLDLNNDGLKDLVAAPNLGNDIGLTQQVGWFYENTNTNENPVFEYQYSDLIVGDMIDFGTGANPVFVDVNADGLLDIVVGNKSYFVPGGDKNPRIALFLNRGTSTNPAFELVEDDYLGLNEFSSSSWRFAPTFGDLDGDGDLDVLVGEEFGNLFYAENIAGPDQPFEFAPIQFGYQDIDVGQVSKPKIIDVNKDGLPDLVIGERNGNMNYYENTGTPTEPLFREDPTNKNFGEIDVRAEGFVTGYSAPVLLEIDGELQLFSGSETGAIRRYAAIDDNLSGAFLETDTNYGQLQTGGENQLDFADINNDGFLEMVVGNIRGGLQFFATDLVAPKKTSTAITEILPTSSLQLFPNPTQQQLSFNLATSTTIEHLRIYNAVGQLLLTFPYTSSTIEVAQLEEGIYLLEVVTAKGSVSKRFVKI